MFAVKKHAKTQSRIDSLIGAGTHVVGDIRFSGGLRIDGQVEGNISTTDGQAGTLVISEHARIAGDVSVPHLVINGTVTGALCSTEFLELQSHARVKGDVQYNTIEIHLGAVVEGRLVHQVDADTKAVELKLAAAS